MNDLHNKRFLYWLSKVQSMTEFGHLWKVDIYSDYFHKMAKN